jgi:hypothetical protein
MKKVGEGYAFIDLSNYGILLSDAIARVLQNGAV